MSTKKTEPKGETKAATKPARVLVQCALGAPDSIVELDAAALKAAEADGYVDSNPAAVAAARG